MREFVKQLIVALKDDEWSLEHERYMRHEKSRMLINIESMTLLDIPFQFSWWERRMVAYHAKQMTERMLVAKLIQYRLDPKAKAAYEHQDKFL